MSLTPEMKQQRDKRRKKQMDRFKGAALIVLFEGKAEGSTVRRSSAQNKLVQELSIKNRRSVEALMSLLVGQGFIRPDGQRYSLTKSGYALATASKLPPNSVAARTQAARLDAARKQAEAVAREAAPVEPTDVAATAAEPTEEGA